MMTHRLAACALALACLASAPAFAAAVSFVSVRGTDTGTCAAIATPCRTFAYALGQTSAHGEIFAIAPGDYGPVTIDKSISITGTVDGAGINTAAATSFPPQITIAAGANDLVYLTGLTLDGSAAPVNTRGVRISSAGRVIIRKCALRNYSGTGGRGVSFPAGATRLLLQDDALSNANDNIDLFGGSPTVIHRVSSVNARAAAIVFFNDPGSMISESSFAGSRDGIFGSGSFLTRSAISGNSGFGVDGNATTGGDNLIRGNATNVRGTLTNIGRR